MPVQKAARWSASIAAGDGQTAWTAFQSAVITTGDRLENSPVRTCQNWNDES